MEFVDRQIECRDCGLLFIWSAGEQQFFEAKGFTQTPKRCKPCRTARRAQFDDRCSEAAAREDREAAARKARYLAERAARSSP